MIVDSKEVGLVRYVSHLNWIITIVDVISKERHEKSPKLKFGGSYDNLCGSKRSYTTKAPRSPSQYWAAKFVSRKEKGSQFCLGETVQLSGTYRGGNDTKKFLLGSGLGNRKGTNGQE